MERLAEKLSSKAKTEYGGEQEGITIVGPVLLISPCSQSKQPSPFENCNCDRLSRLSYIDFSTKRILVSEISEELVF